MKELQDLFEKLNGQLAEIRRHLDVPGKQAKIKQLDEQANQPEFWNNTQEAKKITKERDRLISIVNRVQGQQKILDDVQAVLELSAEEENAEFLAEAKTNLDKVKAAIDDLEFQRMFSGKNDQASAILTINAGAGGTEACDWADMLLRMYRRWADRRGYNHDVVDFTLGDGAGFRSVTLTVDGDYAYGYLKAENGVHRLVRISPFDSNKRRHTSFTSVYVLPDVEEDIEIEIKDSDLRVDTFRSSGAGGQHVNKTDSAVRITHEPTGIVVACQNQRSQHQNRATAMRLLKAKLYEIELEKKEKEREVAEKSKRKIEWGSQIRSYVMHPYQMVKDHRTGVEKGNVDAVMDGDLDEFIREYLLEFGKEE
ncbi:MAG: peptide chain release factor 2 [Pseudomonadota bacterium]